MSYQYFVQTFLHTASTDVHLNTFLCKDRITDLTMAYWIFYLLLYWNIIFGYMCGSRHVLTLRAWKQKIKKTQSLFSFSRKVYPNCICCFRYGYVFESVYCRKIVPFICGRCRLLSNESWISEAHRINPAWPWLFGVSYSYLGRNSACIEQACQLYPDMLQTLTLIFICSNWKFIIFSNSDIHVHAMQIYEWIMPRISPIGYKKRSKWGTNCY